MEDLARICTRANQWVVAEHLGVAERGALLVVAIHRTDRGIDVDGHRLGTGPRAEGPRPRQHRLGDLVELADVAEAESPEERPERRGCHHLVGKHLRTRPRTQHIGVVYAVGAGDHGVHERRDPTTREGVDIDELFREDFEAELLAQHTDESETRVGHCVIVVEHHRQARRAVRR